MDIRDTLLLAVLAATLVLIGVAMWAFVELAKTARVTRDLSETVDSRLIPLIDKADASLDLLNAEMMRIDGIVTQVEEVSGRVTTTSEQVTDAVRAPLAFLVGFADSIRRSRGQRED
jgi:hypothetical protein